MNLLNKLYNNFQSGGLIILLLALSLPQSALAEGFFGSGDEEILWKSGLNLYIKLVEQEKSGKTLPNDHPVTLNAEQITNALTSIEFWEKKGFFKDAEPDKVFSTQQTRLLGNYLSQGLAKAKPDQDIVFALVNAKKVLFGLNDKAYMAGLAFYKDNRLHIIIGDYDRPADKGLENAAGGAGITELQYFFKLGSRYSPSGFKKNIITGDGIDLFTQGNKRRQDWFVIDVQTAAAAYAAKTEKKEKPGTADTEAIKLEAAKLAKERREMRAEMAKMRKEMNESVNNKDQLTVEERLAELDELHKKNLISDAEYEQKRKEILDDI